MPTKPTNLPVTPEYLEPSNMSLSEVFAELTGTDVNARQIYYQCIDGDPWDQHTEYLVANACELTRGSHRLSLKRPGGSRKTVEISTSDIGSLHIFSAFHAVGRDVCGHRYLLYCKTPVNHSN